MPKKQKEVKERIIDTLDLLEHFHFKEGEKELNKLLYVDASLEIFGHAGEVKLNSVEHLNQLCNPEEYLLH